MSDSKWTEWKKKLNFKGNITHQTNQMCDMRNEWFGFCFEFHFNVSNYFDSLTLFWLAIYVNCDEECHKKQKGMIASFSIKSFTTHFIWQNLLEFLFPLSSIPPHIQTYVPSHASISIQQPISHAIDDQMTPVTSLVPFLSNIQSIQYNNPLSLYPLVSFSLVIFVALHQQQIKLMGFSTARMKRGGVVVSFFFLFASSIFNVIGYWLQHTKA